MPSRAATLTLAGISALLALRPFGPADRVADLVTLPSRVAAPLGLPATIVTRTRVPSTSGADEKQLALEASFSARLERAVLRSAWPRAVELKSEVAPIPGEVDARLGRSRDTIRVRVAEPDRVELGQPVVAGDVYVGRVSRIPFREPLPDEPGPLERLMRATGLSSPPLPPPRDAVDVSLVTGPDQRVGGLVREDQEGFPCAMVVGGLTWRPDDLVWLAVHAPERRSTRKGIVVVSEPLGLERDFESLGEGFLIGELQEEEVVRPGEPMTRRILGIQPPIDFRAGINQVLVLAESEGGVEVDHDRLRDALPVVPVLEDGGWGSARLLVTGDATPWRSTLRVNRGSRDGVAPGAALVEGVRLAGRVSDPSPMTSAVATVFDPGFHVNVLAQAVDAPDAAPLAMGRLTSEGRAPDGSLLMRWFPDAGTAWPEWALEPDGSDVSREVQVTLWTGSGMVRVPRGLRIGRVTIPAGARPASRVLGKIADRVGDVVGEEVPAIDAGILLRVNETASLRGPFQVRFGGARLSREGAGQ